MARQHTLLRASRLIFSPLVHLVRISDRSSLSSCRAISSAVPCMDTFFSMSTLRAMQLATYCSGASHSFAIQALSTLVP